MSLSKFSIAAYEVGIIFSNMEESDHDVFTKYKLWCSRFVKLEFHNPESIISSVLYYPIGKALYWLSTVLCFEYVKFNFLVQLCWKSSKVFKSLSVFKPFCGKLHRVHHIRTHGCTAVLCRALWGFSFLAIEQAQDLTEVTVWVVSIRSF